MEDRESQVTFSALGQEAPIDPKRQWDPDHAKRLAIVRALNRYLPNYAIRSAGTTSVDVTRRGIDKATSVPCIEKHLNILSDDLLFVGDALYKGGNDYPMLGTGIDCVEVIDPEETKQFIASLL